MEPGWVAVLLLGLPLVGFEGVRVRGMRPEEVAEVGLMAFSSS